ALTRGVVAEDEPAERRTVEGTVRPEHTGPEGLDDLVQTDRAGRDGVARERVVVDDDGAELGEARQRDGLARRDPSGQADAKHALHPASRRTTSRRGARLDPLHLGPARRALLGTSASSGRAALPHARPVSGPA